MGKLIDNSDPRNEIFRERLEQHMKERKLSYEKVCILMDMDHDTLRRHRNDVGSMKIRRLRDMVSVGLLNEQDVLDIVMERGR